MDFLVKYATLNSQDKKDNALKAVQKLQADFAGFPAVAILYFAATPYDPETLAKEMRNAFPGAVTFGCTSSGELADTHTLSGSVVAMAFSGEAIESLSVAPATNIENDPDAVNKAFARMEGDLGCKMIDLDYRRYVGICLIDGNSLNKENLMERMGELTDVLFVGGGAGDDLTFLRTLIFCDGLALDNAALFAVFKPKHRFDVIKTESFEPTPISFFATRAEDQQRIIWELDCRPAAEVYAEALGKSAADLSMADFTATPLGLMVGGQPFVRTMAGVVEGGGLRFFSATKEGMRLTLLKSKDMITDTAKALATKQAELGGIAGLISFNCVFRDIELKTLGKSAEFGALFNFCPTIGLSSYGEFYIGVISQTATMIAFAKQGNLE